jgi:hypothetical protein
MSTSFWDRYAFSVGGVDFSSIDVIVAAMVRGEWPAFERRLAEGLACAARADAEEASPPDDAIDEAATAYRYERDLISASDVTTWLDRVELSADEWTDYLRRDVLRRQWADELDDALDRFAPSARDLWGAVAAEGICSGAFDTFQQTLAGRVALVFQTDAAQFRHLCDGDAPIDAAVERLVHTHAHWLSKQPAGDAVARMSRVSRLDDAFSTIAERIASNGRLAEIVSDNRLDWISLELDTISFETEAAAREAILCVRADGLSLYDVAALSRGAVDRTTVTLDAIDSQHREKLLAAEPGSVLGPLAVDGRFDVAALVNRTAPGLDDPAVAARARALAIDLAQRRATRDHVTPKSEVRSHKSGGGEAA